MLAWVPVWLRLIRAGREGAGPIFGELYCEGYAARIAGKPVTACPYNPNAIPQIAISWIAGWLDDPRWGLGQDPRCARWLLRTARHAQGLLSMTKKTSPQFVACTVALFIGIGVNTYVSYPSAMTAVAILELIILGIRVCAASLPQAISVRKSDGYLSLFALTLPVWYVWQIAGYTNPPAPWLALLGSGLAGLGYTLAAALVVGHFDALALYDRYTTGCAAAVSFIAGTLLSTIAP